MKNTCSVNARFICLIFLWLFTSVATHAAERDEIVFFFEDAQGSAVAAVSEAGELCWSENYTPYGDKTVSDDENNVTGCGLTGGERGFTGHTEDANSELMYMQQRYYDPTIGRFLSVDPMDATPLNPKTINRYAYANNNPYKYVDPDGELPVLAYAAYVGVVSVLSAYEGYNAYQEGGAGALAESAATNAALSVAGAGLLKAAGSVFKFFNSAARHVDDAASANVRTFQTYTKTNPETGQVYCGRTSG